MKKTIVGAALTAAAISVTAITSATGESQYTTVGDVYKGTGWQINTGEGIFSLDPSQTYLVTYASTTARTKMQSTLEKSVQQLQSLGLKIFNTTEVETVASTACPSRYHIVVGSKYRPAGKVGISLAQTCHLSTNHALASGKVWMDSEYTQLGGTYKLTDRQWKNGIIHEFGHALGLAHAPAAKNTAGDTPAMTAPNGGFVSSSKYGTYTSWDVAGFQNLMENFDS
jgi:hypothetical protein